LSSSLYSELASKYGSQVVEPFKEPVIAIPVREFKPQWEEQLKSEGCKILVSEYLGRASFLIRKSNNGVCQTESKPQNELCETENSNSNQKQHRKAWSREEEERLKQLFMEGKSYEELAQVFNRNKKALQQKCYDLGLKREIVKPNPSPTLKPNPKPTFNENPNSQANNNMEIRQLLEASLQVLPSYPQAAKTLIQAALNQLQG
jgi:hypothetical protein